MKPVTRKEFLQTSALLLASAICGPALGAVKKEALLSFSTLGCPDWSFQQIIQFAAQHGYKGIEMRGLQRQMELPQSPEFATAEARKRTGEWMKEKGLRFVGLGSSAALHHPEEGERQKSLAEARRYIDLASGLGCPYVRVFPNNFPKNEEKGATLARIISGLKELGAYGAGRNVTVLLETHGDVVWTADLVAIMEAAGSRHVGLIWDVTNMWTITKETPAHAYGKLKQYIRHVHVKDAKLVGGKPQYTLLGEGEVPIFEAIDLLRRSGYKGYYSFEWEKLWHPELPDPEMALAHYPTAMKKHFGTA